MDLQVHPHQLAKGRERTARWSGRPIVRGGGIVIGLVSSACLSFIFPPRPRPALIPSIQRRSILACSVHEPQEAFDCRRLAPRRNRPTPFFLGRREGSITQPRKISSGQARPFLIGLPGIERGELQLFEFYVVSINEEREGRAAKIRETKRTQRVGGDRRQVRRVACGSN